MQQLTPRGRQIIEELAQRYGVSSEAVMTMLQALIAGNATMAQFSHPELGGMGQWTQGGMTMVGDMFNNALKAKVDGLCAELADLLRRQAGAMPRGGQSQMQMQGGQGAFGEVSLFVPAAGGLWGNWWGADLGAPSSTGAQNNIRYAFFPAARRLAVSIDGRVTIYDTEDHHISGVSQQQSADASLTFTSQRGLVRVAELRVVSPLGGAPSQAPQRAAEEPTRPAPARPEAAATAPRQPSPPAPEAAQPDDIFVKIERLAGLREKGILSDEEFAAKKAELLSRL